MSPTRKMAMFDLLVRMGYKEIEVGFPSASETDFNFVRQLVEGDRVPEDVTISVLTQAREDLIERSVQSLVGVPRANIHLYNALAPLFRRVVFHAGKDEIRSIAVRGTEMVMKFAESYLDKTVIGYEYSPEIFTGTELPFSVDVCEAVSDVWQPEDGREIILNLPATVEMATPNVYADQIEWFSRQLTRRENTTISLHPHNDRGTAVAATELAMMAGADRVEGCLFGHGERTGNVGPGDAGHEPVQPGHRPADRLLRHRRDPAHRGVLHAAAGAPAAPLRRRPRLHGVQRVPPGRDQEGPGGARGASPPRPAVPSPSCRGRRRTSRSTRTTSGRTYEAVIRVNSQSGKGGVAYILKSEHKLDLPRRLQIEFSRVRAAAHRRRGRRDVAGRHLVGVPRGVPRPRHPARSSTPCTRRARRGRRTPSTVNVYVDGELRTLSGSGNGPIAAFVSAIGDLADDEVSKGSVLFENRNDIRVLDYHEHALSSGGDALAAAYVECAVGDQILWGVGVDPNIVTASLKAVISAVNRA